MDIGAIETAGGPRLKWGIAKQPKRFTPKSGEKGGAGTRRKGLQMLQNAGRGMGEWGREKPRETLQGTGGSPDRGTPSHQVPAHAFPSLFGFCCVCILHVPGSFFLCAAKYETACHCMSAFVCYAATYNFESQPFRNSEVQSSKTASFQKL